MKYIQKLHIQPSGRDSVKLVQWVRLTVCPDKEMQERWINKLKLPVELFHDTFDII